MITCHDLVELLFDFAGGEVPPERREDIAEHLRVCLCCGAYLDSYRLTMQMMRQLRCPPLPPQLGQRLRALLEEEGRTKSLDHTVAPGGTQET